MKHTHLGLLGFLLSIGGCIGYQDADAGDGSEPVLDVEQEVVNGSADFFAKNYIQARTVRLTTPGGSLCSGTLVLPNVIMTARHCVTTDATIDGPLATPSSVRVRIMADPGLGGAANDICVVGPNRDPSCAVGKSIQQISTGTDLVIVGLAAPIGIHDDFAMFTPLELSQDNSGYVSDDLIVSGWGRSTCAQGSGGVLRWGQMTVTDDDGSWTIDGVTYNHLIRTGALGNQGIYRGDSGGPLWGTRTYPAASLSAWSAGKCTGAATPGNAAAVPVAQHFGDVRTMVQAAGELRAVRHDLTSLTGLVPLDLLPEDGTPDWRIVNGFLAQKANAGDNVVLIGNTLVQRAVGGAFTVSFSSSDDDTTGVVFSYVDQLNYLTCEVSEQNHVLQATMMRNGRRSVLASTNWSGDLAAGVSVTADVTPVEQGGFFSFPIRCSARGGGARDTTIEASNSTVLPAGRVGIFNDFLDEVTYTTFSVSQPPG